MDLILKSGTLLQNGKYRIDHSLAKGGFGITYLAYTRSNEKIVIKEYYKDEWHKRDSASYDVTANESTADIEAKYRKKFIKEAQTIMRLKHSNIVDVYEFFEEHGTLYYAMEFINGCSLSDYVAINGVLSEHQALHLIKIVAQTLGFIHSQNELHLDITPRNIMLTTEGNIKLIDFGVSKHYDAGGNQSTTTPVALSRGYAPVEQYLSDGIIKFSPETDIYALTATLFFLLTATAPPDANDRQHFLREGEDLLKIPDELSENVKKTLKFGMSISRKRRLKDVDQFVKSIEGAFEPQDLSEDEHYTQTNFDISQNEKNLIATLIDKKQYKEAYDICVNMIQNGHSVEYAQQKCDILIPFIKKSNANDKRTVNLVITISIIISISMIILAAIAAIIPNL